MSFFFALIFVVLVFLRPQEWLVPALYGWPMLDPVVYLGVVGLIMEVRAGVIELPQRLPQLWLLIGLFFAAILSHVPHTYFGGVMLTYPEVFKITFFTFLLICVLDTERRFRLVAGVFVALACVMAVHALLQQSRGYGFAYSRPLWVPAYADRPDQYRSQFFGIFGDPNDLAQMLTTSIPFAFVLFRSRVKSIVVGVLITWLLVAAVLATHSRGGLVALATAGAVMVSMMLPNRWFPYLMAGLLVGGLALCPLSAGYLDISAHDRVVFWGLANEQFKHNPIFGIGYGMFWQVASSRAAHNAFVLCYTEIGIVGYWFWFGLLSVGILGVWRTRRFLMNDNDWEGRWLRLCSGMTLAAVAGFCSSGYFLSRAFVFPLFFLFAMMAALPRIVSVRIKEEEEEMAKEGVTDIPHVVLLETGRPIMVFNTIATVVSIFYIYFSIVLLNRAFYRG